MRNVAIGEAARVSGVKVPTIRYYEQIGILPAPERTDSQRPLYDPTDLRRLAFIRHARELGFDLEAIRTLLSLQDDPDRSCGAADEIVRARLAEVEQRIANLMSLKTELERMLAMCAEGRVADCRVIETLADSTHQHGRLV
jgi:DNA-binding transcriptional MerR regulator